MSKADEVVHALEAPNAANPDRKGLEIAIAIVMGADIFELEEIIGVLNRCNPPGAGIVAQLAKYRLMLLELVQAIEYMKGIKSQAVVDRDESLRDRANEAMTELRKLEGEAVEAADEESAERFRRLIADEVDPLKPSSGSDYTCG